MSRFAANTSVPVDRTRQEVEQTLTRYGATAFGYMTTAGKAVILFEAKDRKIKITVPLPDGDSERDRKMARQRWRALLLVIKAKLESVESGIETLEEAFFANIVMPDGMTVYEKARTNVALAYSGGKVQALLPDYSKSAG
jgi:hypothetical protein